MAMTMTRIQAEPMAEMNTTPLIDVMLVLLIMFILTIPVATHTTDVGLPNGKGSSQRIDPVRNRLTLTADDHILWNGNAVSQGELASLLKRSRAMPIEPELQFEPQSQASYNLAAQVTHIISASGATNFGFVGNERFATFGKQ